MSIRTNTNGQDEINCDVPKCPAKPVPRDSFVDPKGHVPDVLKPFKDRRDAYLHAREMARKDCKSEKEFGKEIKIIDKQFGHIHTPQEAHDEVLRDYRNSRDTKSLE